MSYSTGQVKVGVEVPSHPGNTKSRLAFSMTLSGAGSTEAKLDNHAGPLEG